MHSYKDLLQNNKDWVAEKLNESPHFFSDLAKGQNPPFLLIGCSDSRKPLDTITKAEPGELFIHRNIANQVSLTDMNLLSIIEFGVEVLKVKHIIVCGHYGCGGVKAALDGIRVGLADNWIRHIQDVRHRHRDFLQTLPEDKRHDALCDLNVIEQVVNICVSTVMVDAWARGQHVTVHGWAYGLNDGLLQDLHMDVSDPSRLDDLYHAALSSLPAKWG